MPEKPTPSSENAKLAETPENGLTPSMEKKPEPALEPALEPDAIDEASTAAPALTYFVVGIGASAGGVEAYIELFRNLPVDTGMAFIVVCHLAPDQKSHLVEILARNTKMPVFLIEHQMVPQPNQVYVLPPKTQVGISSGRLQLEPRPERGVTLAIDHFFRSLAKDQKNRSVGVVLSGMDSDGALGLQAIRGEGGIAIVQAPESARYPDMPRSSLVADHVDLVVPPAEIAIELARLAWQFSNPALRALEADEPSKEENQQLARILNLLASVSSIDYHHYKTGTIQRRIARRMLLKRIEHLDEYVRYLQIHPEELRHLHEDTLIGVTCFFRDPDLFTALKNELLTRVLESRESGEQIRIWVAGCSTGEEVYSIAMCLLERLSGEELEPPVQIFGTDASEQAIHKARMGVYPESISADVSADRLRRFFVKIDKGYQVSKRVRDLCVFARQNLCVDPPFSHLDLVSCRNVLIYLDRELQNRIIPAFHYALRPGGFLVLGSSETIREFDDLFGLFDRKNRVYVKQGSQVLGRFDVNRQVLFPRAEKNIVAAPRRSHGVWNDMDLQRAADRAIVARHAPAGVVINESLDILQSRGHTAPYLEMTPGATRLQLMKMLRQDLTGQVHTSVRTAIETGIPVQATATIESDGTTVNVAIEVLPLNGSSPNPRYYLLLFSPTGPRKDLVVNDHKQKREFPAKERDRTLAQAQSDLLANQLYAQSLIEERDATNQELISANEEIQSANEELQSANEELETTKEELQSANEELQTVNEELQQRNNVLTQTSNDLANLLNSVNIPVLMLNNQLQIRQFTPLAERLMNIRASDIGRPIREIRLNLSMEDLEPTLQDVLDTLGTREMEVQDREGHWRLMRVRPYRTTDNKIEGVVLILVDIDELRRIQLSLRDARDFSQAVIEGSQIPLVVLTMELRIRTVNAAFRSLAGLAAHDLESRSFPDLMSLLWQMDALRPQLEILRNGEAGTNSFETQHEVRLQGERRIFRIWGRSLQTDNERVLLVTTEDISRQANAERLLEQLNQKLEGQIHSTEESLSRTQSELRALAASLFTSEEEERRRVARELHDDITQRLAVLEIDLEQFKQQPPTDIDAIRHIVEGLRQKTAQLSEEVRGISHRLHPSVLDDIGLATALRILVEEFGERENMPATFMRRNVPEAISPTTAGVFYRITQEALRNVAKHAGRTHVKVSLERMEQTLRLQIADSGEGFDPQEERSGLGLISMAERARTIQGGFSIRSALGAGTTVTVDVPFGAE